MKIKRGFGYIVLCVSLGVLSACSDGLAFRANPQNLREDDDDSNNPGSDDDPQNPGGSNCDSGENKVQRLNLTPNSIAGANVMLVIDESGSMDEEIDRTVSQIQQFIDRIFEATGNNYRIGLVFDKDGDALNGVQPFSTQLAQNPQNVFYFESETWSKWSDIAVAKAFLGNLYEQTLPINIPLDYRISNGSPTLSGISECNSALGYYFRPRAHRLDRRGGYNVNGTQPCNPVTSSRRIQDYFLPGIDMNIITISDDDNNVSWDIEGFLADPTADDAPYPEIIDLMFKDVIRPLGAQVDYRYHSIVGPVGSTNRATVINGMTEYIELDGLAHLALSRKTGGTQFDVHEPDWQPLFDALTEDIIFSEQRANLVCAPEASSVEVYFDGVRLPASRYRVDLANKRIRFLPAAFEGLDPETPIQVEIRYRVS